MENVSACLLEKLALSFLLLSQGAVKFPSQFGGVSKALLPTSLLCPGLCRTDVPVSPLQENSAAGDSSARPQACEVIGILAGVGTGKAGRKSSEEERRD